MAIMNAEDFQFFIDDWSIFESIWEVDEEFCDVVLSCFQRKAEKLFRLL